MLATTAHTNSIEEDNNNNNKISQSKSTFDITLSEGAVGLDVEDTLTTPSEGATIAAQFIDRNANKDLGRMLRHKAPKSSSRKPNSTSHPGRKRS